MKQNNQTSFNPNHNQNNQNNRNYRTNQTNQYDYYQQSYPIPQNHYGYGYVNRNMGYQYNGNQQQFNQQQQYYSYPNQQMHYPVRADNQSWGNNQHPQYPAQAYKTHAPANNYRQDYRKPEYQTNYRKTQMTPSDPRKKQYNQMQSNSHQYNKKNNDGISELKKYQKNQPKGNNQIEDQQSVHEIQQSESAKQSQSEDEQQLYQKTKVIYKKRDPVLDTPQQIKKWVQARKRNYPKIGKQKTQKQTIQQQMSILQSKIRKKIMLISADGKGLMKKLKNMHILKRLIIEPNAQYHKTKSNKTKNKQDKIQEIKKIKQKKMKAKQQEMKKQYFKEPRQILKKSQDNQQNSKQNSENQQMQVQIPIKKQKQPIIQQKIANLQQLQQNQPNKNKRISGLTPADMINHLKQKQEEDKQFYNKLLDYKTNSLNYKYTSQTLQTNFLIEDIFQQSSYLLQIIRYVVKNNFFNKK